MGDPPSAPLLVLLPGLDGTGELFRPLIDVMPKTWPKTVVSYPLSQIRTHAELQGSIEAHVNGDRPVVLIAESFSGPIALRYACEHPANVRAVVLCASFVRPPLPNWLAWFATPFLFRLTPPAFLVRRLMVGRDMPSALVESVRSAVGRVDPRVLARRVRDVLNVYCEDALRECPAPIMYLRATDDALIRGPSLQAIRDVRPDVHVRFIAGPHLLLQSRPEECWREIQAFLERCAVATAPGVGHNNEDIQ